jgi:hypothetical protein
LGQSDINRLRLFEEGRAAVDELERRWPSLSYLSSLRAQLDYLEAVERGAEPDRTRLTTINIGVITAKDIEDRDRRLADVLHEIAGTAREMETKIV